MESYTVLYCLSGGFVVSRAKWKFSQNLIMRPIVVANSIKYLCGVLDNRVHAVCVAQVGWPGRAIMVWSIWSQNAYKCYHNEFTNVFVIISLVNLHCGERPQCCRKYHKCKLCSLMDLLTRFNLDTYLAYCFGYASRPQLD